MQLLKFSKNFTTKQKRVPIFRQILSFVTLFNVRERIRTPDTLVRRERPKPLQAPIFTRKIPL